MPPGERKNPRDVRMALWLLELGLSLRRTEARLHGRIDHVTLCRMRKEMKQSVSQQSVSQPQEVQGPERNIETELSSYNPTGLYAFNHGLGTRTPSALVRRIVERNSGPMNNFELRAKQWELQPWISGKDQDPELGKHRQALKDVLMRLGFSPESDNDNQYGTLNKLAYIILKVHKKAQAEGLKLNPTKLVEAAVVYHLGESYRGKLETIEKRLLCPRCKKPRSYVLEKDGRNYLCVSCGRQIPRVKARFKVKVRLVDEKYLSLIREALQEVSNKVAAAQ